MASGWVLLCVLHTDEIAAVALFPLRRANGAGEAPVVKLHQFANQFRHVADFLFQFLRRHRAIHFEESLQQLVNRQRERIAVDAIERVGRSTVVVERF